MEGLGRVEIRHCLERTFGRTHSRKSKKSYKVLFFFNFLNGNQKVLMNRKIKPEVLQLWNMIWMDLIDKRWFSMCADPLQRAFVQGKQSCDNPVLLCQLEWEQLHMTQQIGFRLCDAEVIPNDYQTTVPYLCAALFIYIYIFFYKWGINYCLQKRRRSCIQKINLLSLLPP